MDAWSLETPNGYASRHDALFEDPCGALSALAFFHPLVRRPLHALTDRAGALYDGLVVRRPQTS